MTTAELLPFVILKKSPLRRNSPPCPLKKDMEDCFAETGLDDVFFTLHEEVRGEGLGLTTD